MSFGAGVAIGHLPASALSPQDEALFQSFQSNLLSLISHELRTPLMGVLNALSVLEDHEAGREAALERGVAVSMARQNADRLAHALSTLLDLASIESGTFHLRLREAELGKVVRHRLEAFGSKLRENGHSFSILGGSEAAPILCDPQRLGRGVTLVLEVALPRMEAGTPLEASLQANRAEFRFQLSPGKEEAWDLAWSQGLAGYEAGLASPSSVFAGVLQSEQAFLTRSEEGLGSEFLLIHQILRLHGGRLEQRRQGRAVRLGLVLPVLSSEEGLRAVLQSRAYQVSTELASVALALIRVPPGRKVSELGGKIRSTLFRSTDAAYPLEAQGEIALVLDDCKPEDAPGLLSRLARAIGEELQYGIAHCPSDGLDPAALVGVARKRIGRK